MGANFARWSAASWVRCVVALGWFALPASGAESPATEAAPTSAAATSAAPTFTAPQLERFEKEVRPLLVQHCHRCHGDQSEPKGGLRLLARADLLTGGDTGPAIVPGKPDESLLIQAVRYGPDAYQMPPQGKLADSVIATLTAWVADGAPWPAEQTPPTGVEAKPGFDLAARRAAHWSWQPIQNPSPPAVRNARWSRGAVDQFLLARLEAAGLEPAAAADRATLLRRATFDLIGLPPTVAELEAFLADTAPDAYERVVDRLLASPHYGERWGRHWLDLVRFAETHGHEFDYELENAWQYRDYVVRAFNADVPYDQLLTEHLAGDLLATPRRHPTEGFNESIIGTGFFHFGEATHSPVDIRGDEADRIDNQLDVLCKTFLGLTVACARCHDHKFDAISTKDYYGLVGFLRSSHFQQAYLDGPERNAEPLAALRSLSGERRDNAVAITQAGLQASLERLPSVLSAARMALLDTAGTPDERIARGARSHQLPVDVVAPWVAHLPNAARQPADPWRPWAVLAADANVTSAEQFSAACHALAARLHTAGTSPGEVFETFSAADYANWSATGEAFATGPTLGGELLITADPARPVSQALPAGLAHSGRTSYELRGVLRSATFEIRHKYVAYRAAGRGLLRAVVDSHRVNFGPLHGSLNHRLESGDALQWHVQNVGEYLGHRAHIELVDEGDGYLAVDEIRFCDDPPVAPAPAGVIALLEQSHLGSFDDLAGQYQQALRLATQQGFAAGSDSAAERELLNRMLQQPGLFPLTPAAPDALTQSTAFVERQRQIESRLRESRRAPALADGSGEDMAVHIRGNHKQLGDVVPRRSLEAFGGLERPINSMGSGRLELARQWLSPENPLVARVIANRVWLHHFGEGLVASPDDFGEMGQPPTHPELLDHLAGELVREGWSLKRLHRQLLSSSAYRMSSRPSARSREMDPQNKLLQHMRMRRLEAEAVRDAVLAVAGTLDATLGGPSVPVYLTEYMAGRGRPAKSGPLDGARRRSLYLSVRRNFMTPLLMAFDFPQPSTTMGRRNVSNVPAQGLALMNDRFVVEQAAHWGESACRSTGGPAERITLLYRAAFGRDPHEEEIAAAQTFWQSQRDYYAAQASAAPSQTTQAATSADASGASSRQAWNDLCHALLSAKEFLFIE